MVFADLVIYKVELEIKFESNLMYIKAEFRIREKVQVISSNILMPCTSIVK